LRDCAELVSKLIVEHTNLSNLYVFERSKSKTSRGCGFTVFESFSKTEMNE